MSQVEVDARLRNAYTYISDFETEEEMVSASIFIGSHLFPMCSDTFAAGISLILRHLLSAMNLLWAIQLLYCVLVCTRNPYHFQRKEC